MQAVHRYSLGNLRRGGHRLPPVPEPSLREWEKKGLPGDHPELEEPARPGDRVEQAPPPVLHLDGRQ